ncbi:MAG: hypothetical protein ABIK53_01715 [bacterium]
MFCKRIRVYIGSLILIVLSSIFFASPLSAKVLYKGRIEKEGSKINLAWRYVNVDYFGVPTITTFKDAQGNEISAAVMNLDVKNPVFFLHLIYFGEPKVTKDMYVYLEYKFEGVKKEPDLLIQLKTMNREGEAKKKLGYSRGNFLVSEPMKKDGWSWMYAEIDLIKLGAELGDVLYRVVVFPKIDDSRREGQLLFREISICEGPIFSKSSAKAEEENTLEYKIKKGKKILAIMPKTLWATDPECQFSMEAMREVYKNGYNVLGYNLTGPSALPETWSRRCESYEKMGKRVMKFPGLSTYPMIKTCYGVPEGFPYRKMVWYTGYEQDLPCPVDEKYWQERMIPYFLDYAKLSKKIPIFAIQVDWEYYGKMKKFRNVYTTCYCDGCWAYFQRRSKVKVPQIAKEKRNGWLREHNLDGKYQQIFFSHTKTLAEQLRKAVDEINPELSFWFIPWAGSGGPFLQPLAIGLSSRKAPIVVSNEGTYGKVDGISDDAGIESNVNTCLQDQATLDKLNIPYLYLAATYSGLGSPEYHGRAAIRMAEVSDGLWFFEDVYPYRGENAISRKDLWRAYGHANLEINYGTYEELEQWKTKEKVDSPDIPAGKIGVGLSGTGSNILPSREDLYSYDIKSVSAEGVKGSSVSAEGVKGSRLLILQNFNVAITADNPVCVFLRKFVEEGGRLFLTHDTGYFMASPFPEIVEGYLIPEEIGDPRHILDTAINIEKNSKIVPSFSGKTYETSFNDHLVFKAGPEGKVIAQDTYGYPVIIAGKYGKGKVIFSGCWYGRMKEDTTEADFTRLLINWLLE